MVRKATTTTPRTRRTMSAASRATAQQKPSFANAIFFDSPSAFGTWLSQNHATATEVFVGYYKKHTGRQVMPWSQAVDEALCWGWIDGQVKSIDSNRTAQRFTPRKKKGSHWSRINVEKVAILEAAGRMRDPGRAAFALRTEENTAQTYFEREAKGLSEEFKVRLETDEGAAAYVEGRTPGYRRQVFDWIMSAKRPETRERRLVELIESSAQQLDVRQFRR